MKITKNVGMLLLAIWLILWGSDGSHPWLCAAIHYHGSARHRSRGLNPSGSVSGSRGGGAVDSATHRLTAVTEKEVNSAAPIKRSYYEQRGGFSTG
jgi:hypothetical protein